MTLSFASTTSASASPPPYAIQVPPLSRISASRATDTPPVVGATAIEPSSRRTCWYGSRLDTTMSGRPFPLSRDTCGIAARGARWLPGSVYRTRPVEPHPDGKFFATSSRAEVRIAAELKAGRALQQRVMPVGTTPYC